MAQISKRICLQRFSSTIVFSVPPQVLFTSLIIVSSFIQAFQVFLHLFWSLFLETLQIFWSASSANVWHCLNQFHSVFLPVGTRRRILFRKWDYTCLFLCCPKIAFCEVMRDFMGVRKITRSGFVQQVVVQFCLTKCVCVVNPWSKKRRTAFNDNHFFQLNIINGSNFWHWHGMLVDPIISIV